MTLPQPLNGSSRRFGFEKQMVVPGPDGTVAHAQLKIGPGIVMLGSARGDQFGMKTPASWAE